VQVMLLGDHFEEEEDVRMVRGGVCVGVGVGWTRGSCICVELDELLQGKLAPTPSSLS